MLNHSYLIVLEKPVHSSYQIRELHYLTHTH